MSTKVSKRCVEAVFQATRFGPTNVPGKEHWRIIGTTDIDGKGTTHAFHSLDPFIFLDESLNPAGVAGLGGGGHPHAGLTAITYLNPNRPDELGSSAHGRLQPWDNFDGAEQPINNAGGVYVIAAGRGVVHDEKNITEAGVMHQFQLWVDPGHAKCSSSGGSGSIFGSNGSESPDTNLQLPLAKSSLHLPTDIPIAAGIALGPDATDGAWCRVIIGEQFGVLSPQESPVVGGLLYLHLSLPASGTTSVKIPPGFRGIIYMLEGEALVGGTKAHLTKRQAAMLSSDASEGDVCISNPSTDQALQLLLAAGAPQHSGTLYKTLGNGGAMFASSENAARACMARFESDPENFGKSQL
jgi:redox-sensitive bicupin YhaK (pirin superfamily)